MRRRAETDGLVFASPHWRIEFLCLLEEEDWYLTERLPAVRKLDPIKEISSTWRRSVKVLGFEDLRESFVPEIESLKSSCFCRDTKVALKEGRLISRAGIIVCQVDSLLMRSDGPRDCL